MTEPSLRACRFGLPDWIKAGRKGTVHRISITRTRNRNDFLAIIQFRVDELSGQAKSSWLRTSCCS